MGYAFAMSPCLCCGVPFAYNPVRVPSFRDPRTGSKEPVCQWCLGLINAKRAAMGLEPFVPLPDAYEACDESELW